MAFRWYFGVPLGTRLPAKVFLSADFDEIWSFPTFLHNLKYANIN